MSYRITKPEESATRLASRREQTESIERWTLVRILTWSEKLLFPVDLNHQIFCRLVLFLKTHSLLRRRSCVCQMAGLEVRACARYVHVIVRWKRAYAAPAKCLSLFRLVLVNIKDCQIDLSESIIRL